MAVRETLEQRIADIWQKWRTSGAIWARYGIAATREREITEEFSAHLARVLLEEAQPYIQHKAGCSSAYHFGQHQPCSCGLAELMEGWSK